MNEVYTYPDGSQRVGAPPFPKRSPLEEARGVPEAAEVVEVEVPEARRKPGRPKKAEQES